MMGRRRRPNPEQELVAELRNTLARLVGETENQTLTDHRNRTLRREVLATMGDLRGFLHELDPIKQPAAIFDPSDPRTVGRFIALALVAQPLQPLASVIPTYGSGVYAIYYNGDFPLYETIAGTETPIYVGKAAPDIGDARSATEQGAKLSARLDEHRANIVRAENLNVEHFAFRSLVVQSGWETAAEAYLIRMFRPVWNSETRILYGLGKHGDSADTRGNRRSPWDTLHPGRRWAGNAVLVDAKSPEQIAAELSEHFGTHPVFPDLGSVLNSFIEELKQE